MGAVSRPQFHSCQMCPQQWPALYKAGNIQMGRNRGRQCNRKGGVDTQWVAPLETKKDDLDDLEQVCDKAMSVAKRGVTVCARTLPHYDITNDDWCLLHKNKATNTLKVWTDGGHANGETTTGVYVGDRFKDILEEDAHLWES